MALKDWKEIGKYEWKKDRDSYIKIEYDTIFKNYNLVKSYGLAPSQNKFLNKKPFKTKSAALNFAKAYMRKH